MTLAGRSGPAPALRAGSSACVRKKGVFTLRSKTLSQPLSGKSSKWAPQAAPALLTRMCRAGSFARNASAKARAPSTVEMSAGRAKQFGPISSAAALHWSALRAEM